MIINFDDTLKTLYDIKSMIDKIWEKEKQIKDRKIKIKKLLNNEV